jgi:hypothetical protein
MALPEIRNVSRRFRKFEAMRYIRSEIANKCVVFADAETLNGWK